jgi:cysteine-rich repeat protein
VGCGNGQLDDGEECDDGNQDDTDACTNACKNAVCGDGITGPGEECDDGNDSNNDACVAGCKNAVCGDGFVGPGEACDDGNQINTDACTSECKLITCGNGQLDDGEECDDGNQDDTDECTNACLNAACGDGITGPGEECDDGNQINTDACTNACQIAVCGDGITGPGEECDDGNAVNTDACTNTCKNAACGDGFLQAGVEECDDGNQINTDACTNACKNAKCGDGIVGPGEQCDDGNSNNNDGCKNDCSDAACGDGIVGPGEECDDGNQINTDACTNTCKNAKCGDGFLQAGEECDDGNSNNNDGCTSTCKNDCNGPGEVLDKASGSCYFVSSQEATWTAARAACIARGPGWDLSAPSTDTERAFVAASVKPAGVRVWTAGREIGGAANGGINAWKWITGETWNYPAHGAPWSGPDNPSNDSPNDCVEMIDDDGSLNDISCGASARYVCERTPFDAPKCRDGKVEAGEQCDDGNTTDTDACLNNCRTATCGDGVVRSTEQCDDENKVNGDGCTSTCQNPRCGNGILEPGETCDDGNSSNTDACINNCTQFCPTSTGYHFDPATGSCYRLAAKNGTTPESKVNCASFGANWNLATLSTQQDLNFYADNFDNQPAVLLDGTNASGVWVWGNGAPWVYPQNGGAPWAAGEPNDNAAENCLSANDDGTLNSTSCDLSAPALCKRVPASCLEIKRANPGLSGLGVYFIDPPGAQQGPMRVVCDMSTDGGGWTMGILKNSMHIPASGQYTNFGSTFNSIGSLAVLPTVASSINAAYAGSMNLNAFPYTTLRVVAYENGAETSATATIRRAAMRLNFGQSGYMLYRDPNLLYWCGGTANFADNGIGQINKPIGATDDCKNHSGLGAGWDISLSPTSPNQGLTVTGISGSSQMNGSFGGPLSPYGQSGRAQAIWVR